MSIKQELKAVVKESQDIQVIENNARAVLARHGVTVTEDNFKVDTSNGVCVCYRPSRRWVKAHV